MEQTAAAVTKLPSVGTLLSEAWSIFKQRAMFYIGFMLIPVAIALVLFVVVGAPAILLLVLAHAAFLKVFGGLLLLVLIVVGVYLLLWSSVAFLQVVIAHAERISVKEAFRRARSELGKFFLTSLLAGLAVAGGFVLVIIPGLIFLAWFSQSTYIVLVEHISGKAALSKSKSYVKGRTGAVLWRVLFVGIITALVSILLQKAGQGSGRVLSNIFSLVWTPISVIYGFRLYEYIRGSATQQSLPITPAVE